MSTATETAETFTIISAEGRSDLVTDFEGSALTAGELIDVLALFEDDAPEGCYNKVRFLVEGQTVRFDAGSDDLDAFAEWLAA